MSGMTAHIHREYDVAPFMRFAMTVVEDDNTDHGYRVSDYDPAVADSVFMSAFHHHMARPTRTIVGGSDGDIEWSGPKIVYPKQPGFFDSATRSVPNATRCHSGR